MTNSLIAALLTIAVATAQTAPQATRPGSATGTSKAAAGPERPIPEQPLRTKLRNANSTNPNYNREKDQTGRGAKREYTPRRTASGVRKDTLNQRKPGDPVQN